MRRYQSREEQPRLATVEQELFPPASPKAVGEQGWERLEQYFPEHPQPPAQLFEVRFIIPSASIPAWVDA